MWTKHNGAQPITPWPIHVHAVPACCTWPSSTYIHWSCLRSPINYYNSFNTVCAHTLYCIFTDDDASRQDLQFAVSGNGISFLHTCDQSFPWCTEANKLKCIGMQPSEPLYQYSAFYSILIEIGRREKTHANTAWWICCFLPIAIPNTALYYYHQLTPLPHNGLLLLFSLYLT